MRTQQGQAAIDTTSITVARTSPMNSSKFVEPMPLMIHYTPATSITIGAINQSVETWWKNQAITANASTPTFFTLLKDVDHLINLCSKGAGPGPDLFVSDLLGYEVIAAALRSLLRYVDYEEPGFPWKAIRINGSPYVFDQFVPDVATPSTTIASGAKSTMYAVNTKFLGMTVYSGADFTPGPFVRAPNGAGESSIVQWYGAHWCSRRDKQGVLGAIPNNLAA